RRLRGNAAGNRAAGTRPVFDDKLLAQRLGQAVGENARCDIGATTGTEPDQNVDWLGGPILCKGGRSSRGCGKARRDDRSEKGAFHDCPPWPGTPPPRGAPVIGI